MSEYYQGMFGSLKHNINMMLCQIEGNLKNAEEEDVSRIKKDLEFTRNKINDIIDIESEPNKKIREFVDEMVEKYDFDREDVDRWIKIQEVRNGK